MPSGRVVWGMPLLVIVQLSKLVLTDNHLSHLLQVSSGSNQLYSARNCRGDQQHYNYESCCPSSPISAVCRQDCENKTGCYCILDCETQGTSDYDALARQQHMAFCVTISRMSFSNQTNSSKARCCMTAHQCNATRILVMSSCFWCKTSTHHYTFMAIRRPHL